ncbi:MAG: 30S ribosome-binding factor RbfA [Acidobacteriota bacterium]|nr:30S ribosome-binding factor RbfA [Acidobacteriota bacterium]
MQDKSYERNARLEGEIRSVLSELLRLEVNDPRLTDVTVSGIKLSADRSKARVYFSVIGDEERERQAADGFSAAASFMRRRLGQTMRLRVVPTLDFHRDTSYEYGDRMERLFDRLADQGLLPGDESGPASTEEEQ